jgi:hypothetical protein
MVIRLMMIWAVETKCALSFPANGASTRQFVWSRAEEHHRAQKYPKIECREFSGLLYLTLAICRNGLANKHLRKKACAGWYPPPARYKSKSKADECRKQNRPKDRMDQGW